LEASFHNLIPKASGLLHSCVVEDWTKQLEAVEAYFYNPEASSSFLDLAF
jgi:hypothetical protein